MSPLTSMFARVASGRSGFALPAVAALSRAARSGDHDLILGNDASKRQLFGCAQHRRSFCTHSSSAGKKNLYNEFFYEKKDIESDEAIWALYHRWCKHHKVQRDQADMVRRFDEFKNCAHEVYRINSLGVDLQLNLNKYSDTPVSEMCSSRPMISAEAHARLKALGGVSIEWGPFDD